MPIELALRRAVAEVMLAGVGVRVAREVALFGVLVAPDRLVPRCLADLLASRADRLDAG